MGSLPTDGRPVMDGYVRVSRVGGRKGDSYISPRVQREAIERWAEYRDVEIGMMHIDEDSSGGTHQRPKLELAINRAISHETDGIIVWKIDRFSRQTEGALRDLRRLKDAGSRLAFVVEDIDTGSVYGMMIYTILLSVSEAFLENIKISWDTAKHRAVERGVHISRTPWGWLRGPGETLIPHPQRAEYVQQAFQLAASQDVQAAHAYLRRVAPERDWTLTKVRRLLSQRTYLGEIRYGEHVFTGDTAPDPLVTVAVWEAAQASPVAPRGKFGDFPLSGIAVCSACGQTLVGGRGGTGQRTYRCAGSLSRARQRCNSGPTITAAILEDYLRDQIRELLPARVVLSRGGTDLTSAERQMAEAQAELEAFAADGTLRRALGQRYQVFLQQRVDAVDHARDELRRLARDASQSDITYDPETLVTDNELLVVILRSLFERIEVRRGRGLKASERVTLTPLDLDGVARMSGS